MPAKRKYPPQHSADTPVLPGGLPLDLAVAVYLSPIVHETSWQRLHRNAAN
jgi:hypothetical protein